MNWADVLGEIEDLLFPQLAVDVWERVLYYHLLRRTHGSGVSTALVSIEELAQALAMSDWKARKVVRSLAEKGAISIEERSRRGHLIRTLLPEELGITRPVDAEPHLDLEALDFYTGRKFADELVQREKSRCFYCLRDVTSESCELDHLVPTVDGGDNSYRNIVASCHDCNAAKGGSPAQDWLRGLYRRSMLSAAELEARIEAIDALQDGRLVPRVRRAGAV